MVKCAVCERDLDESNFSPGLLHYRPSMRVCRPCANERLKEYQSRNRDKVKDYNQRYEEENRDKRNAKYTIKRALKTGRIEKKPCAVCGATSDVEGHHFSYAYKDWLSVIWVCPIHHKAIHAKRIAMGDLEVTHGRMSTQMRRRTQEEQAI